MLSLILVLSIVRRSSFPLSLCSSAARRPHSRFPPRSFPHNSAHFRWHYYTCQLFLRYKREIFILGVLGFLKTTRSFPKIPEEVRSIPKTSEVCRSLPKASSLPVLFASKIRDREEGIAIYSFYTWSSFLTWVWVNIFLEIVSSRTATTHIFQSGVRNWPAGVSRREIEVFNLKA